jgi:hypothetical protein
MVMAALLAAGAPALGQPHEEEREIDVPVGINASGQIVFGDFDFTELFGLDFESVVGGSDPQGNPFDGLFTDNPGFRDLVSAGETPTADFQQPFGAFEFAFELISIDTPLRMADPLFVSELAAPGDQFFIGDEGVLGTLGEIDSHPFFFVAASDVVPGTILGVTGRVVDLTGGFAASAPFTFNFLIPSPSAAAVLAGFGLVTARRRR